MIKRKRILVIGDIMLDEYIMSTSSGQSPEANAPLLNVTSIQHKLGGASNVAASLCNLNCLVTLVGIYGNDQIKNILDDKIREYTSIENQSIVIEDKKTTLKTRVYADGNYQMRLDHEDVSDINDNATKKILKHIKNILTDQKFDAVLLQDYNKGLFNSSILKQILSICGEKMLDVFIDPKIKNWDLFKNVFLLKPNLKEAKIALHIETDNIDIIKSTCAKFVDKQDIEHFVLTIGENGILHYSDKTWTHSSAKHIKNPDVCGAGDAVISVLTTNFLDKLGIRKILDNCNTAGAQVCQTFGVNPVSPRI